MDINEKLYKIGMDLNLSYNNHASYGYIKNTFAIGSIGGSCKNQSISFELSFPCIPDEEDMENLKSICSSEEILMSKSSGYTCDIQIVFYSPYHAVRIETITKTVTDVANYIQGKYSGKTPFCSCKNCKSTENVRIYREDSIPFYLCYECAAKFRHDMEELIKAEKDDEKRKSDNYLKGFFYGLGFSTISLAITLVLYKLLGSTGFSGVIFYFFAAKGFDFAKCKSGRLGKFIRYSTTFFCTALGIFLNFALSEILDSKKYDFMSILNSFEYVLTSADGFYLSLFVSLFLCLICICCSIGINESYREQTEAWSREF